MGSRKRTAAALGACVVAAAAAQTVNAALTIELKVKGTGATSVSLNNTGPGSFVEFDVFARVSSLDARPDAVQIAEGGFRSINVGGTGAARGSLSASVLSPFTANGSSGGTQADLDADGDLDIGGTDPTSSTGYFVARAPFMVSPGSFMSVTAVPDLDPGPDYVVRIGTARFDVSSVSAGTGNTEINFTPRQNEFGALWSEDSDDATFNPLPGGTGATFTTKDGANPAEFRAGAPIIVSFGDPAQWNQAAGGSWGTSGNWIGGVPDAGATARLLGKATSNATLTLDGTRTLSHLIIDNAAASYTVNAGSAGSKIVLNNETGLGTIVVGSGSHTLNVPVDVLRAVEAQINGASKLTVAGGVNVADNVTLTKTGTGTLANTGIITLGTGSKLVVQAGALNGAGGITASGTSTVDVGAGSVALTGGSTIAANRTLTKAGAGTLGLGNVTMGASSTLSVSAGAVTAGNVEGAGGAAVGTTNVAAGAKLTATRVRQASLNLAGTAASKSTVTIAPSAPVPNGQDAQVSVVNALTIANDGATLASGTRAYFGKLDLGNNDLIVRATAGTIAQTFAEVQDMVRSGLYTDPNGTFWAGQGIASSTAAADAELRLGIGVIRNENPFSPGDVIYDTFDGISGLTINDVLVKVTYFGDNDLSGEVDATDIGLLGVGLDGGLPAGWISGDYDYSKVIDGGDIGLIGVGLGNAFGQVPEPGTLSLAAIGAAGLLRRRRRTASAAS